MVVAGKVPGRLWAGWPAKDSRRSHSPLNGSNGHKVLPPVYWASLILVVIMAMTDSEVCSMARPGAQPPGRPKRDSRSRCASGNHCTDWVVARPSFRLHVGVNPNVHLRLGGLQDPIEEVYAGLEIIREAKLLAFDSDELIARIDNVPTVLRSKY